MIATDHLFDLAKRSGFSDEVIAEAWDQTVSTLRGVECDDSRLWGAVFKMHIQENLTFVERNLVYDHLSVVSLQEVIHKGVMVKWLSPSEAAFWVKLFHKKRVKAAIQYYLKLRETKPQHEALHIAASNYDIFSDKVFLEIIRKLDEKGKLLDFVKESFGEDFMIAESEEGAPTNTSEVVAPDRDHVGAKKPIRRRKHIKTEE